MDSKPTLEETVSSTSVKAPTSDENISWTNYLKLFETDTTANEWSERENSVNLTIALRGDTLDVLQTISE